MFDAAWTAWDPTKNESPFRNDVRMMLQKEKIKQREKNERVTWKVGDSRILDGFLECVHRKLNQNSVKACWMCQNWIFFSSLTAELSRDLLASLLRCSSMNACVCAAVAVATATRHCWHWNNIFGFHCCFGIQWTKWKCLRIENYIFFLFLFLVSFRSFIFHVPCNLHSCMVRRNWRWCVMRWSCCVYVIAHGSHFKVDKIARHFRFDVLHSNSTKCNRNVITIHDLNN